jgi:DNA-directed RNA polymerase specialized sigma24 family protein
MTTIPVRTFRELFRHLQAWTALYETEGKDTLTGPDGTEYCLHDIDHFYREAVGGHDLVKNSRGREEKKYLLSPRQRQAIRLFLYENRPEREVARTMGVSEENPVASYATQGLVRLNQLIKAGTIPRYSRIREDA